MPNTSLTLPIGYYFHSDYHRFREELFADGANYVGHELMVPELGDYRVLETTDDAWILLRETSGACVLLSNICRHQQAKIIDPKNRPDRDVREGNLFSKNKSGLFVCPVHKWSYQQDGALHHAPAFPEQSDTCLPRKELKSWNGMLFDTPRDITSDMRELGHSALFDPQLLDMSAYVFMGADKPVTYTFSWEQFITVYFDLYHVAPYHPSTFAQIVDCENLAWEFGERYSMQIAGWKERSPRNTDTEYGKVWATIDRMHAENRPPHGALWLTMYPGVMVEWYPHVLVISTLRPNGPEGCINHVEYYVHRDWHRPEHKNRAQDIFEDAEKAYQRSAKEDQEICQSMHESYRAMWQSGDHFVGPFHPHLEQGITEFFRYIRNEWARKFGAENPIRDKYRFDR